MLREISCDALVLGAGPAGLTAAIYLKRANQDVRIIKGKVPSALAWAHEIGNYPGVAGVSGPELLARMEAQATALGIEIIHDDVIALTLDMDPKMVSTKGTFVMARAVVIATGKGVRKPELDGEETFIGKGVSYCATCDGPLYKDRPVIVLGADDEAADDVLILEQMGARVTWILKVTTRDATGIKPETLDAIARAGIPVIESAKNLRITGDEVVRSIVVDTASGSRELPADCIFVMTSVPTANVLGKAGVALTERKSIDAGRDQQTSIPGVFAAGDACGNGFQVSIAVGEGAVAGMSAARYLRGLTR